MSNRLILIIFAMVIAGGALLLRESVDPFSDTAPSEFAAANSDTAGPSQDGLDDLFALPPSDTEVEITPPETFDLSPEEPESTGARLERPVPPASVPDAGESAVGEPGFEDTPDPEDTLRSVMSYVSQRADASQSSGNPLEPTTEPPAPIAEIDPPYGPDNSSSRDEPGQSGDAGDGVQISFGGGAVAITAPWNWRAYELSVGRELRLMLTPLEVSERDADIEGLWIACHVMRDQDDRPPLSQLISERIRQVAQGTVATRGSSTVTVGNRTGVRQEFAIQQSVGFHVLLETEWGVCEVHARSSGQDVSQEDLEAVFQNIRLPEKELVRSITEPRVEAAGQLVGSWKAYRSRLRISGDGRIEIEPEKARLRAIGEAPREPSQPLRGDFEAKDDLIFVRWDDGSFLNFRWRLDGDVLRLTDHEGRISELRPLLE